MYVADALTTEVGWDSHALETSDGVVCLSRWHLNLLVGSVVPLLRDSLTVVEGDTVYFCAASNSTVSVILFLALCVLGADVVFLSPARVDANLAAGRRILLEHGVARKLKIGRGTIGSWQWRASRDRVILFTAEGVTPVLLMEGLLMKPSLRQLGDPQDLRASFSISREGGPRYDWEQELRPAVYELINLLLPCDGVPPPARVLSFLPLDWPMVAVAGVLVPILCGGAAVLGPTLDLITNPESWVTVVAETKVSVTVGPADIWWGLEKGREGDGVVVKRAPLLSTVWLVNTTHTSTQDTQSGRAVVFNCHGRELLPEALSVGSEVCKKECLALELGLQTSNVDPGAVLFMPSSTHYHPEPHLASFFINRRYTRPQVQSCLTSIFSKFTFFELKFGTETLRLSWVSGGTEVRPASGSSSTSDVPAIDDSCYSKYTEDSISRFILDSGVLERGSVSCKDADVGAPGISYHCDCEDICEEFRGIWKAASHVVSVDPVGSIGSSLQRRFMVCRDSHITTEKSHDRLPTVEPSVCSGRWVRADIAKREEDSRQIWVHVSSFDVDIRSMMLRKFVDERGDRDIMFDFVDVNNMNCDRDVVCQMSLSRESLTRRHSTVCVVEVSSAFLFLISALLGRQGFVDLLLIVDGSDGSYLLPTVPGVSIIHVQNWVERASEILDLVTSQAKGEYAFDDAGRLWSMSYDVLPPLADDFPDILGPRHLLDRVSQNIVLSSCRSSWCLVLHEPEVQPDFAGILGRHRRVATLSVGIEADFLGSKLPPLELDSDVLWLGRSLCILDEVDDLSGAIKAAANMRGTQMDGIFIRFRNETLREEIELQQGVIAPRVSARWSSDGLRVVSVGWPRVLRSSIISSQMVSKLTSLLPFGTIPIDWRVFRRLSLPENMSLHGYENYSMIAAGLDLSVQLQVVVLAPEACERLNQTSGALRRLSQIPIHRALGSIKEFFCRQSSLTGGVILTVGAFDGFVKYGTRVAAERAASFFIRRKISTVASIACRMIRATDGGGAVGHVKAILISLLEEAQVTCRRSGDELIADIGNNKAHESMILMLKDEGWRGDVWGFQWMSSWVPRSIRPR